MNHGMSCWLLLACLVAPLGAQESKSKESPRKGLLELLDRDLDQPGLGELREQLKDLQELMDRMRAQLEDLQGQRGLGGRESSSLRTSIRTGRNGVRVEVLNRDADGEGETKVYEAPDMESFKEKYPEVARRFFTGGNPLHIEPPVLLEQWSPRGRIFPVEPQRVREPAKGERLGIYLADLAPEVGAFLDLELGQGLLVKEVTDDSLAQALGIEAGDVVYEIDGAEIFSATDVAKTLGAIDKGEPVKVKVNRKGRDLELEARKLEGAERTELKKVEERKAVIR